MAEKSTREVVLDNYNTITGRSRCLDAKSRRTAFRALSRGMRGLLPKDKNAAILDVGCGEGVFLDYLQSNDFVNLQGVDISSENVTICHERGLPFVGQGNALSWFDQNASKWAAIFCLDVIEHIPKDKAVGFLRKMHRALNTDGYLVLHTPNMGSMFGHYYRYSDLTHEVGYAEQSLCALLKASGFSQSSVMPSVHATTAAGRIREALLPFAHRIFWALMGMQRPRIWSPCIFAKALK